MTTNEPILKDVYRVNICARVWQLIEVLDINKRTWQTWRAESLSKRTLGQIKTMSQFGEFSFDINKYLNE